MQSNSQQSPNEAEQRTGTEQSQGEAYNYDEHDYDDGLVHSHGWASSSHDR